MTDDTRNRVLNAAGPIFAEKGYGAATVREICAAANTNQAAINYHFGDKQALYLEVVKLAHQRRMEQVPAASWPVEAAPGDKLRAFVLAVLTRMLETRDLQWPTCLLMREMLQPTIACGAIVEDFIRPQLRQLLDILDELLPAETPVHRRHQMAFSVIGQCLHYRVAGEFVSLLVSSEERAAHYGTEQLADHIADFTLAALRDIRRSDESSQAPDPKLTASKTL